MSNGRKNTYTMTVEQELAHVKNHLAEIKHELKMVNHENLELKERISKAEAALNPVKQSLEKLTAENGKRLRREARVKNRK